MAIFLTGDTHGGGGYNGSNDLDKLHPQNFPQGKNLTKKDLLIILGDFGLIFDTNFSGLKESLILGWLNSQPWTTLFLDGNHENFDRLNQLPQVELDLVKGTVGQVSDSVFHLQRGQIYTIENQTFFVMGGAVSYDKDQRNFLSWWKQELPSYQELELGLKNLETANNQVDFILTHAAPFSIVLKLLGPKAYSYESNSLEQYLENLLEKVVFKHWFFGHWHVDCQLGAGKFTCLYRRIIQLT